MPLAGISRCGGGAGAVTAWAEGFTNHEVITNPAMGAVAQYATWTTARVSDPAILQLDAARQVFSALVPGMMIVTSFAEWPTGAYLRSSQCSQFATRGNYTDEPTYATWLADSIVITPHEGPTASLLNFFDTFGASKTVLCRIFVAFVGLPDNNWTNL